MKSGMQKLKENLEFDAAYIKKGPTSAYPHLKCVVKENGQVMGLHPGAASGKELADYFPELFRFSSRTPILDKINRILEDCSFNKTEIEISDTVEYLHAPLDGIKFCCFGQTLNFFLLWKARTCQRSRIYSRGKLPKKGLAIIHSRYIVRVTV